VDFGVVFPTTQIGDDPSAIRDFAQAAEELGFRRLLTYDHVLGAVHDDRDPPLAGPYTEHHPFHEPFVLFGFLAACTSTIERRAGLAPRPVRGDLPLWYGGGAEAALQRAARNGDGFVFGSVSPHPHERAARLRELLAEQGRDPQAFPMETVIDYSLGPDVWAEQLTAWEASGGDILSIRTMSSAATRHGVARVDLADPAAHIAALREFAEAVGQA
jgi:alkanesulfonate monooxygenase SsuD/methylene tetrahydromethanopterin reductase-like flavin-dependent oxidoreductase (luciferase family)